MGFWWLETEIKSGVERHFQNIMYYKALFVYHKQSKS